MHLNRKGKQWLAKNICEALARKIDNEVLDVPVSIDEGLVIESQPSSAIEECPSETQHLVSLHNGIGTTTFTTTSGPQQMQNTENDTASENLSAVHLVLPP